MNPLTSLLVKCVSTKETTEQWEKQLTITNQQLTSLLQNELPNLNDYELESLIPLLMDVVKPLFDQERIKGVRYIPDEFGGKYQARIELPNKSTPSLGTYNTVVEANAAMKAAAKVIELLSGQTVPLSTDKNPKGKGNLEVLPDSVLSKADAKVCSETGKILFRGGTYDTFAEALNTP